jgi:hypothetical protein
LAGFFDAQGTGLSQMAELGSITFGTITAVASFAATVGLVSAIVPMLVKDNDIRRGHDGRAIHALLSHGVKLERLDSAAFQRGRWSAS